MTLKYIRINGLFHHFYHEIVFRDKVAIVIGDNGVGKTVTLKIIDSIFNRRLYYLYSVAFDNIRLSFGNEIWTISKQQHPDADAPGGKTSKKSEMLIIDCARHGTFELPLPERAQSLPPYFRRVSQNEWLDRHHGIIYGEQEISSKYGCSNDMIEVKGLPEWIISKLSKNSVRLIDTQRIYDSENNDRIGEIGRTVNRFSRDIARRIQEERNLAEAITSRLDRTFPSRLINLHKSEQSVSATDVLQMFMDIDNIQQSLHKVGLGDYKKDDVLKEIGSIDQSILRVLSLYAEDAKQKLQTYDALQKKLSLFLDIINDRFEYKECRVDKNRGFVFVSSENKKEEIPLAQLSSGEQNEFVLFYDLLFNCSSKDLILIDEPELSLHIKWQQKMISDLMDICGQTGLNLLIATHSPDLIGNNWSLVQKFS